MESNVWADNVMYTALDHGKIHTRATPVLTTRPVWGTSLHYTPSARSLQLRQKKKTRPTAGSDESIDHTNRAAEFCCPTTPLSSVTPGSLHHHRRIQLVMLFPCRC